MVKSELIDIILKKVPPLKRKDVEIAVNTIFEGMKEALIRGEKIEIRGFGSFRVKKRRPRIAQNPRDGSKINLPERRYLLFRAGKELKRLVNEEKG